MGEKRPRIVVGIADSGHYVPPVEQAFALFGPGGAAMRGWVQAWAAPRPERVPIRGASGLAPSPELAAWMELFETHALETADPAEAELRAPGDLPDLGGLLAGATGPSAVADLYGRLTASVVIAQQDELAYLASVAGTAAGVSRVFTFHPEDWGLHPSDASISARLHRLARAAAFGDRPFGRGALAEVDAERLEREARALERFEAAAAGDPLPAHLDPEPLGQRAEWLVRGWLGLPLGPSLARAPGPEAYADERSLLESHPHLGLYWLFASALEAAAAPLEGVLAATRAPGCVHLAEARVAVARWVRGHDHALGPFDLAAFEALREAVREARPPGCSASGPRAALMADPEHASFLELWDHLAGPDPEAPWRGLQGRDLEDALAERARPAHRDLLDQALARAAAVPDHHPRAGRGRILARAAIARDLGELDRALEAAGGTERFGPRRRAEVWRAVARFSSPEARARLARGAASFAREAEDWIRTSSKVPWDALLACDAVETHDLVARFTAAAPLTPVTEPLVVEAARAARAHGIARAVPGLRRAAAGTVGRLDDGSRAEVTWAVAELDAEGPDFLSALLGIVRAEWEEAEDEEDAERLGWSVAACAGPLLSVAPDHLEARAAAATLLGRLARRLGPGRRPRPEVLEATRALVDGARIGPVRALDKPIRALARLRPEVGPASRPAAERLRAALERFLEET
jgi:hypothetical protein